MFVQPTHDHVPDIDRGGYLPQVGRDVEPSPYWLRRLTDGDVTESNPPAAGSSTSEPTTGKGINK
jgi:hypothetical protein